MFQLCKNDPVESGIPWTKLITDQFKINGLLRRLSLEHITEMGQSHGQYKNKWSAQEVKLGTYNRNGSVARTIQK